MITAHEDAVQLTQPLAALIRKGPIPHYVPEAKITINTVLRQGLQHGF